MVLDLTKQIIERIRSSSNILILLGNKATGDGVAAALALRSFLHKLDKQVTVVAPLNSLNSKYSFLPGFDAVHQSFNFIKNFVIDVSTKRVGIEELSYKKENDHLAIFLKPKSGQFDASDITFRNSDFPFELIICLNISSLDSLGSFYGENAELFFEVPIINIDNAAENENFGQFNLVRLNASAASEIVFDLINEYESSLIDEEIATNLLTGIISETNSFQHHKTTPAAFIKASQLVSLGGNQQEIIKQLYKTKNVGFLKLWGRVLARLKQVPEIHLAYSLVTKIDLEKSMADVSDVGAIIKEMASQLGFAKIFMFILENESGCTVYLATHTPLDLMNIFANFRPEAGGVGVKFQYPGNLISAETEVINRIKEAMLKPTV